MSAVTYQWDADKKQFPAYPLPDFVDARAASGEAGRHADGDVPLGRSGAMAINLLAQAGFTKVYNIIDGMEGDAVKIRTVSSTGGGSRTAGKTQDVLGPTNWLVIVYCSQRRKAEMLEAGRTG